MRIEEWDGGDAFGVDAATWAEAHPTKDEGKLLFVVNDDGTLAFIATHDVRGGGNMPITEENYDAVSEFLLASAAGSSTEPATDPVTREEFDMLMTMVLEG
jgi:hypothetical protein